MLGAEALRVARALDNPYWLIVAHYQLGMVQQYRGRFAESVALFEQALSIGRLWNISDFADVRREALLAHSTQVDPNSRFWFGLPPEVMASIHPHDDYRLAQVRDADGRLAPPESLVVEEGDRESDLFAGVPGLVSVGR